MKDRQYEATNLIYLERHFNTSNTHSANLEAYKKNLRNKRQRECEKE